VFNKTHIEGLEFDPIEHSYYFNGVKCAGVTGTLENVGISDFSMVPIHILEKAQEFGTEVHKRCEDSDLGRLDESTLTKKVALHVFQWIKFLKEMNVKILEVEHVIFHPVYKYAGTLDRIAEINGKRFILDIKTGKKMKSHQIQTAAYLGAYQTDKRTSFFRACVHLAEKGYSIEEHKNKGDFSIFLAALSIRNYKENKKAGA